MTNNATKRIALLHPDRGPINPDMWSGTPHGLLNAFRQLEISVVEVGYDLPRAVTAPIHLMARASSRGVGAAEHHELKMSAREMGMRRALLRAGDLDAVVAVGTHAYRLNRLPLGNAAVATYDDTTLQSMWTHEDSDTRISGVRAKHVTRWIGIQRRSIQRADVVCVSTKWAAHSFERDYGVPGGRVAVVGMGHRPRTAGRRSEIAAPRFLFVGVDWKRKNGDAVIRAFAAVRRVYPGATLDVVGRHPVLDADGVVGHGVLARDDPEAQRQLDDLYASATAFVLPSLFDPAGIVYLEAASAGLPVVSTKEGGASELLGAGAIAVQPRSDSQIIAAMLLLARSEEAVRRGEIARKAAETSTWTSVAERMVAGIELAKKGDSASRMTDTT